MLLIKMETALRFGPAGMPLALKGKKISEGISYLSKHNLNAIEVQFTRGVRIRKEDAIEAEKVSKEKNVLISCHAPYWINCCSPSKEKQVISDRNIMQSLRAAQLLNARIIVIHVGFYQKQTPQEAFDRAYDFLKTIVKKMKQEKIDVLLGLETTGKPSQFGSLDEILLLCKKLGKMVKPVIDFAHLHARENGKIKNKEDYKEVIDKIKKSNPLLLTQMHCHFSEIEYTEKGERYHLVLGTKNSPPFKPLAELIKEKNYKFTIICESPNLDLDALKMQDMCK